MTEIRYLQPAENLFFACTFWFVALLALWEKWQKKKHSWWHSQWVGRREWKGHNIQDSILGGWAFTSLSALWVAEVKDDTWGRGRSLLWSEGSDVFYHLAAEWTGAGYEYAGSKSYLVWLWTWHLLFYKLKLSPLSFFNIKKMWKRYKRLIHE